MTTSSEPRRCPACSAEIPATAPQGLCPKCLLLGVASVAESSGLSDVLDPVDLDLTNERRPVPVSARARSSRAQANDPRQTPPSVEELAAAFPQLEVLELVGRGGMGFVYKARQPKLDRLVALKILPGHLAEEPSFHERFEREARVLAKLQHPLIVSVYDFGEAVVRAAAEAMGPIGPIRPIETPASRSHFYLMLEFVDGVNLREAMRAGRFTPDQALAIVPQVCEALQYAHSKGVLHRDIKPENILLDTDGRVKIADFGIAKVLDPEIEPSSNLFAPGGASESELAVTRLTATGAVLGTPLYMAPEQLISPNSVDHRADIFSLGVVFYEMLTGELPMGRFAPPSEKSLAHQQIDQRIDEVVLRALAKERELRQQSAGELKTEVETISATPRPSTMPPPIPVAVASSDQPRSLSAVTGDSPAPRGTSASSDSSESPWIRRSFSVVAFLATLAVLVMVIAVLPMAAKLIINARFTPPAIAPPAGTARVGHDAVRHEDPFAASLTTSPQAVSAAEAEAKRLGLIRVVDEKADVYTFQQPIGLKGAGGEVLVEPHFSALVRFPVPSSYLAFTSKQTGDSRQDRAFIANYPCDYIACDWTSGTDKPRIMGYLLPPGAYDFRADAETGTLLMETDSTQRAKIAADTLTIIRAAALKSAATESDWQQATQVAHVRFKLVPKSISKLSVPEECLVVLTEKSKSLFTRSGGNFTKHEFVTDLNIRELRESIRPPVIVIDREFYEDTPADATVPENLPR